jgi:hypothetical protein
VKTSIVKFDRAGQFWQSLSFSPAAKDIRCFWQPLFVCLQLTSDAADKCPAFSFLAIQFLNIGLFALTLTAASNLIARVAVGF